MDKIRIDISRNDVRYLHPITVELDVTKYSIDKVINVMCSNSSEVYVIVSGWHILNQSNGQSLLTIQYMTEYDWENCDRIIIDFESKVYQRQERIDNLLS